MNRNSLRKPSDTVTDGARTCRRCGSALERPGDYCLVCRTHNSDTVVVEAERDRARVVSAHDGDVVGERVVTTVPEDEKDGRGDVEGRKHSVELRNFVGLVADEVRRKRPDDVYARGVRDVIRKLRKTLRHDLRRLDEDDDIDSVLEGDEGLDVVETPPEERIGGEHTTLIGGNDGRDVVHEVVRHPHVKKVIPGPIDAGGRSSAGGFGAKVTRSDHNGNLRLLIRDGSSIQENRVVTTATGRESGERIRDDLNELLDGP